MISVKAQIKKRMLAADIGIHFGIRDFWLSTGASDGGFDEDEEERAEDMQVERK